MNPAWPSRAANLLACLLILGLYAWMIDLKGISTDEGFRLWIINGGHPSSQSGPAPDATWSHVLAANSASAYQPLYFLIQNSFMRLTQTHELLYFRLLNLGFLGLCLTGLYALSPGWHLRPRLFLLVLFSCNAFMFMHVLQIREYIAGVAFYIWSTWLVLRLDARKLARPWADTAWFIGYGLLLVAGFFLQSWTVFPAIGQGAFLLLRRGADKWRFYAHLTLSYLIVVNLTWPYVQTHQQKVNVGLWASEQASLWTHLSNGFHLVLSGHLAGQSRFADFLCWFWLAVIVATIVLFFGRFSPRSPQAEYPAIRRPIFLLSLCIASSLAFQIGYFYQVENLSVWPRYFIIHYFFLTWLIALGFNQLHTFCLTASLPSRVRPALAAVAVLLAAVLSVSAIYQIRSFRRDPMLDTGQLRDSNWRSWSDELGRMLQPGDILLVPDFIIQSTLTFTSRLPAEVRLLTELPSREVKSIDRIVYLESTSAPAQRGELAGRLQALGFTAWREFPLHRVGSDQIVPEWNLLIFTRP